MHWIARTVTINNAKSIKGVVSMDKVYTTSEIWPMTAIALAVGSFSGLTGGGEPARIAIGTLGHPRIISASVSYSF
jgi:hypothetical protein